MTIGELARRTGMTVRNIRAHQTRGLLPPPEVHGRTGYYDEEHVARIELTREMQADGLNLEAIRRVLESVDGSAAARSSTSPAPLRVPFEDEAPEIVEPAELANTWAPGGKPDPDLHQPGREARHAARASRRPDRGDQPAPAAGRRRAGRARGQARGRPGRRRRSCAATPRASPAPSSTSSSRRSGSRSSAPAAPRRTGRRCARRSTGCGRSPPARCSRCSRSRWARRPRRRAIAPSRSPPPSRRSARSAAAAEDAAAEASRIISGGWPRRRQRARVRSARGRARPPRGSCRPRS